MTAPATKPDAAVALAEKLDALVREEHSRDAFIDRAFEVGRSLGLDDEQIRSAALPVLHRHYNPPHHPTNTDQRIYESALAKRYQDRSPASTVAALEYLMRQPDARALACLHRRTAGK